MSNTTNEIDDSSKLVSTSRTNVKVLRTIYFFYFAGFGIITTFLNVYYRDIGLSGLHIGMLSSVIPLISFIAAPMWGILNDRYGRVRNLLIISCLSLGVAISGIGLAGGFFWLVIFTAIYAFFDSSILTIIDSTTLRSLGKNREGFGRERVWGSVGFIVAVWGVGFILQQIGAQWFFLFYVLTTSGVLVTLFWLPNQKVAYKPAIRGGLRNLIFTKKWLIFSISLMLMGLGGSAINGFLGIYIKDLGGSEGLVGTASALATVTELPVMYWGMKILKRYSPWQLLMVAFGATTLRLLIYGVMPSANWVIPVCLLHSLTFGLYWIAIIAYVDQLSSNEIKSSAQGILYSMLSISRMLGSLVSGVLYDIVGAGSLFQISAAFSLLALLLFSFNKQKKLHL